MSASDYLHALAAEKQNSINNSAKKEKVILLIQQTIQEIEKKHWHEASECLLDLFQNKRHENEEHVEKNNSNDEDFYYLTIDECYELHAKVINFLRADISSFSYARMLFATVIRHYYNTSESASTNTNNNNNKEEERAMKLIEEASNMIVGQEGQQSQAYFSVACIKAFLLIENTYRSLRANASIAGEGHAKTNKDAFLEIASTVNSAPNTAKRLLSEVEVFIKRLQVYEADPLLIFLFYWSRLKDLEYRCLYTKYYNDSFHVVSYAAKANICLPQSVVVDLSKNAICAALLSEEIFNVGKFLNSVAFTSALLSGGDERSRSLLTWATLCNEGKVKEFEAFYHDHILSNSGGSMETELEREIRKAQAHLSQKIRLMTLLHLIFYTPVEERIFSFAQVSETCSVPYSEDPNSAAYKDNSVELLLLEALAQGVVRGSIDGVERKVKIRWVQPRVLAPAELLVLAKGLKEWANTVRHLTQSSEEEN